MVNLPVNVEQKLVYERSDCRISHSSSDEIGLDPTVVAFHDSCADQLVLEVLSVH